MAVFAGSRVTFRAVENQFIRQSDERGRSVPVAFVPLAIGGSRYIAVIERNFETDPEKDFNITLWRKAYPVVPGSHALLTSTGLAAELGSAGIALESTK